MGNFGETLRRERELRDVSLREIADATKINLRYLEALEQNRFDILPGGVFNKGFIRAFARYIGADGESLVDLYLLEVSDRETRAAGGPVAPGAGTARGLLRPSEAPKRRADALSAAPPVTASVARAAPAVVAAASPSAMPFGAASAEAQVKRHDAHPLSRDVADRLTGLGGRPLVLVLSLVGAAAAVFVGLLLVRALWPHAATGPEPAAGTDTGAASIAGNTAPGAELPTGDANDTDAASADASAIGAAAFGGTSTGPAPSANAGSSSAAHDDRGNAAGGTPPPGGGVAPMTPTTMTAASRPAGTAPGTPTSVTPTDAGGARSSAGAGTRPPPAEAPPLRVASPVAPPPGAQGQTAVPTGRG